MPTTNEGRARPGPAARSATRVRRHESGLSGAAACAASLLSVVVIVGCTDGADDESHQEFCVTALPASPEPYVARVERALEMDPQDLEEMGITEEDRRALEEMGEALSDDLISGAPSEIRADVERVIDARVEAEATGAVEQMAEVRAAGDRVDDWISDNCD